MEIVDIVNKNNLVLGLGKEGCSVVRFLLRNNIKPAVCDILEYDKLDEGSKKLIEDHGLQAHLGPKYMDEVKNHQVIWRSPGVWFRDPLLLEAKDNGATILSQTEWFLNHCRGRIIGVTGTKGKGTTSTLIYEMFKRQGLKVFLTGNIGLSDPLDFIDEVLKNDFVVFELSSFQLEDITRSPDAAVVLMVTSEHLDHHKDLDEYVFCKQNIVRFQTKSGSVIANKDYENSRKIAETAESEVFWFSRKEVLDEGCFVQDEDVVIKFKGNLYLVSTNNEIGLLGEHNIENVCAASFTAFKYGVSIKVISEVVKEFKGLPHRLEFVREHGGVKYYNDSFSTVPETSIAAMNAIVGGKVVILGGSEKKSDFSALVDRIKKGTDIEAVILLGESGLRIKDMLVSVGYTGKVFEGLGSMKEVVDLSSKIAEQGQAVLLSPGAASFGMFKNYKDRGDQFKKNVMGLRA